MSFLKRKAAESRAEGQTRRANRLRAALDQIQELLDNNQGSQVLDALEVCYDVIQLDDAKLLTRARIPSEAKRFKDAVKDTLENP